MRERIAHRDKGQIIVIVPLVLLAFVSMLGLVFDLATFRLLKSEMQNAADSAALAAIWYDPACPFAPPYFAGCASDNSLLQASTVEYAYANINNSKLASALCGSPPTVLPPQFGVLRQPNVPAVTVVISCSAGWVGARLFGMAPIDIWVTSTAAIGPPDATGNISDFAPVGRYIARLVP